MSELNTVCTTHHIHCQCDPWMAVFIANSDKDGGSVGIMWTSADDL